MSHPASYSSGRMKRCLVRHPQRHLQQHSVAKLVIASGFGRKIVGSNPTEPVPCIPSQRHILQRSFLTFFCIFVKGPPAFCSAARYALYDPLPYSFGYMPSFLLSALRGTLTDTIRICPTLHGCDAIPRLGRRKRSKRKDERPHLCAEGTKKHAQQRICIFK